MPETRYLSIEQVKLLHRLSIAEFGGSDGLRDGGLLESAVTMPQAAYFGQELHSDLAAKAAAYLFHLSQAHPFVDGNKRTAMAAALTFIRLNGADITANNEQLIELGLSVAAGTISKDELTDRLRKLIVLS